jgi:Zn-dependent protease with chaperone function
LRIHSEDIYLIWFVLTLLFAAWRLFNALGLALSYPVFSDWLLAITIGYGIYLIICFFFVFLYRKIFVNPIADIAKKLGCRLFLEEQKPGLTDTVRKIASDLEMRTPELLVTSKAENAALCIGKDKDDSAIVLSEDVLKNFSLKEISSILAHELSHAKLFLRQRMHQVLTRAFLFRKVFLAGVLMMVPFESFFLLIDLGMFESAFWLHASGRMWSSGEEFMFWIWLRNRYTTETSFIMLLLLSLFLGIIFYTSYKDKAITAIYSEDTSEFLADAYSSFYFNDAKTLKSAVEKLNRYMAQKIFSLLESKYSSLFFVKDRKAYKAKHWPEVLHERLELKDKSEYSPALRLKAITFLDNILTGKVKLKIVKDVASTLSSLRLYRGFVLFMIWTYVFSINKVKKKNVKKVLEYVSEHQESFDINDCSKQLTIPKFHVFLILSMLIANRVIEVVD